VRKLTDDQIRQKLAEGRNYKRLYFELKDKCDSVIAENKQLKQDLQDQKQYFEGLIETQAAQIAELQTMVYGRKNRFRSGGKRPPTGTPRDATSYRRPKPPENEVTSEEHHAINACHHCGGPLTEKEEYTKFIEDIILAALDQLTQFKTS